MIILLLMSRTHTINTPKRKYDIFIGDDILPLVLEYVKKQISGKRQAIVTDGNVVAAGHLARLDPEDKTPVFIVKPDENGGVESKKNIFTYGDILDFLDDHQIGKKDTLICLGGGVIGDMGGFVAATYKRGGMTYIQVPTTTLSQADSSVGGKCAIDTKNNKNGAGAFYQPHFVASDISSLLTVDSRNYRSGLVESVKHGLILDKDYFELLEKEMEAILSRDMILLEEIALRNVRLKGSVVEVDPDDENYRNSSNFGHTFGHAIEIVSDFQLYHGEAIALGLLAAMHISHNLRGLPMRDFDRAQELLVNGLGMLDKVPSYVDRDQVIKSLPNDKKADDAIPQFVTIDSIGKLHVEGDQYAVPIPKQVLTESMDYIF